MPEPRNGLDLRQHFALERTLLAYIRTGLALVAVGFVIARFGLLLREFGLRDGSAARTHGASVWFGSALVLLGGLIGPLAGRTYLRQLHRLNAAMKLEEKAVPVAVVLSVILAAVGIGMAGYLLWSG